MMNMIKKCRIFVPMFHQASKQMNFHFPFCTSKDKTQISVTKEDIEKIKKIVGGQLQQSINTVQVGQQQQFFTSQQTKLSLKVIQVETLEQLKPYIKQYSSRIMKRQGNKLADLEMLRCKFIIFYKYKNLTGNINSDEIKNIYDDIAINVELLDEQFLTIFYRILAEQIISNPESPLKKKIPLLPLIQNTSHTNSELLSLFLMVYPKQVQKIYIHYHLVKQMRQQSYREGYQQPMKTIVYDPVNLIYLLKYFQHYQDIQQLVSLALNFKDVEAEYYHLEETINTQEYLKNRQILAFRHALRQGYTELCQQYLFDQSYILRDISFQDSYLLLKDILTAKNIDKYKPVKLRQTIKYLLQRLSLSEITLFKLSEIEQLSINQDYHNMVEIITIILTRQRNYLQLQEVKNIMQNLFQINTKWKVNFSEFSYQDLFKILACYKGCRDYLFQEQNISIDNNNQVLTLLLLNLKEQIKIEEAVCPLQIFYSCFFASSFGCLNILNTSIVISKLKQLSHKNDISQTAKKTSEKLLKELIS